MKTPTWDILIASIEHRADKLIRLLDTLGPQLVRGVGIIVYRDNLEASIGDKRQRLVEASNADYISFIDDDDSVPSYHVSKVRKALREQPDYVGWQQRFTWNGIEQNPVYHSLRHRGEWWHDDKGFYRGITHFNQVRREHALRVSFEGGGGEDNRWAQALESLGCVSTEVYIDQVMHFHDEITSEGFWAHREPLTKHPKLPIRPSVTFIS